MNGRSALGSADVTDDALAAMVADLFAIDDTTAVTLVESNAEPVPYDIPAITTGGRWWVRGTARVGDVARPFTLFVKQVHEWSRSPFFADVPPEIQAFAAQQVPWRTEGAVYRSDLGDHLPPGLTMPRAVGVHEIDDLSYSVWLEEVPAIDVAWDLARHRSAAFFTALPVGFDCGQLLVGDVQIGRRSPLDLAERGAACLASYVDGLAAEGVEIDTATVRRAHALHLLLFTALSALPFELLDADPDEQVRAMAAARATIARYVLDLVEATG